MIFHFYFHFHKNLTCHDFSLTALNCELRHLLNRGNKKIMKTKHHLVCYCAQFEQKEYK